MEFTHNEDNILNETVEMKYVDDSQSDDIWKKEKGEKKFLKIADIIQTIFEVFYYLYYEKKLKIDIVIYSRMQEALNSKNGMLEMKWMGICRMKGS